MTPEEAIKICEKELKHIRNIGERMKLKETIKHCEDCTANYCQLAEWLKDYKRLLEQARWIPVGERFPEDLEPVNITWVNHEPEPYYHDIKDKNFVATGIYYRGQWYWYSTTCADYLGEYGSNEIDEVDSAIEIVAWMPLPEPYEPQESENI